MSVPVRDNLAVLPLDSVDPGASFAPAVRVVWYRDDGTQTVYTDQNSAVPFAGAPPWPFSGGRAPAS